MSALVTLACAVIAFPIAYYAARYARGWTKALFYLAVMMPLWSSYLVKVYAWKLILAKEGIITWFAEGLHLSLAARWHSGDAGHRRPVAVVQLYRHVSGLRLYLDPLHDPADPGGARARAGQLHRGLRRSRRRAAADVLDRDFPLALPGIIAGSIFTFSLTLGDYIIPQIVGNSRLMIGQAVYTLQGTAGNIPLAAAFTVVPMVIMGVYLWMAKRMGAFDVL